MCKIAFFACKLYKWLFTYTIFKFQGIYFTFSCKLVKVISAMFISFLHPILELNGPGGMHTDKELLEWNILLTITLLQWKILCI